LPRAVRSLLAQTWQDFEILVVDDNPPEARISTDPVLANLLRHPKVRVLTHEQPLNASAARNFALGAVQGEWITYLDDDDAYQAGKLERQLQRALKSGLPVGTCGVTFHLARRERKRVLYTEEVRGSELLLMSLALPTLFHRKPTGMSFDEKLFAGEDAYYFYGLLDYFKIDRIFNVPESLVDVYPQHGPRVNSNAEGLWQACQAIYRDFAPSYGLVAAEAFLTRSRLGRLKFQPDGFREMSGLAWKLIRLRGRREFRFVVNSLLFKFPFVRRFLVS
jgi:glycosyltransferase involved in cell wall biosynthesis